MQKNKIDRIVLTGGHAGTTAIAFIEELKSFHNKFEIHWIGPKKAVEGKNALTLEAKTFPRYGVFFHSLIAGKLQRKWSKYTIYSLLKVPVGFVHSFVLLKRIKPNIIVSFGGYAALPVCITGYLLRIPVVLQEQITGLGFANRMSLPFATKVSLARKEGLKHSGEKGIVTGIPVRKSILNLKAKKEISKDPTVFIFAGSRGSKLINNVVFDSLDKLLDTYKVVHQTGELDFERARVIQETLTKTQKDRYEIVDFIDPDRVAAYYEKSDILIGRAGANTVSEAMIVGIPSLLIPLTWTNYQEQVLNAKEAEARGIAKVVMQDDLDTKVLLSKLSTIQENWTKMARDYKKDLAILDRNASRNLLKLVLEVEK